MVTVLRHHTLAILLFAGWLGLSLFSLAPRNAVAAETDPALGSVTDLLGRQVKVHLPVRRVILGEGRQLYLVAALDTQNPIERIVGWRKDLIQSDPDTYGAYLRKYPDIAKIPTFGGFEDGTFDIEQAISQRPDVIILNIEAQHATEDARYIEKLDALGIPVVYVDFRNNPMQNTEPTMRLFGQLFGKQARAEAFIDFRNQQIRRVTDVIEARHPARPRSSSSASAATPMIAAELRQRELRPVRRNGRWRQHCQRHHPHHVRPVERRASGGRQPGAGGGHQCQLGSLCPWRPLGRRRPGADLAQARQKLAWYTQRPAYAGIKAQDDQAFHAIWHQFYNSPYQFVAIQQLAKWFHPTLFADLDPDASFRQLHEQFLPVPYEPGYAVSLRQAEDKP